MSYVLILGRVFLYTAFQIQEVYLQGLLMSILGFVATDLEANQCGHLSSRQQQLLSRWSDRLAVEPPSQVRIERITGLVAVDEEQPPGKRGGYLRLLAG